MNGGNQLKYKKLVAAGCSFIQGCELGDENSKLGYSVQTYPALIAKHYDLRYECLAYGGASNTGIANMILNHDIHDSILLVQWTYESRIGMHTNFAVNPQNKNGNKWFDFAPGHWDFDDSKWDLTNLSRKLMSAGIDKFNNDFYRFAGNDETFLLITDLAMKSVLYQASVQNVKVLFFTASDSLIERNGCMGFDGYNFLEFSHKHKCPMGYYGHPLHEAHRLTADYVLQNVNIKDD